MVGPGTARKFEAQYTRPQFGGGINQGVNCSFKISPIENLGFMGQYIGEDQPVTWDGKYGPVEMGFPARADTFYYVSSPYDDEAVEINYVRIGLLSKDNADLIQRVSQELSRFPIADHSPITAGKNANGLPIADTVQSSGGSHGYSICIGACQWGPLVVTVTVYNHEADRVKLILNSIKPPAIPPVVRSSLQVNRSRRQ